MQKKVLKDAFVAGARHAAAMAVAVPVLGLGVHFLAEPDFSENYSLKNRFETAYSFKTPKEHKRYTGMCTDGSYRSIDNPYWASPYATYGVIALAGIWGAASSIAAAKKKQNRQQTR